MNLYANKKEVIFRVDSGDHIGSGHAFRCLSLAKEFDHHGFSVLFICRSHRGNINEFIREKGFLVTELCSDASLIDENDSTKWLGQTIELEIEELNAELAKLGNCSLIIIDHYSIGGDVEAKLFIQNILVIDDLERSHCARYVVDQSISSRIENYHRYSKRRDVEYFIGPTYALLSSSFRKMRNVDIAERGQQILAYFGSTDLSRESLKVVNAFISKKSHSLKLRVILPESHVDYLEIKRKSESNLKFELISFSDDMATEISRSDICFGACGVSVWERACLGKPSVVITSAENQRAGARELDKRNLVKYLGSGAQTSQESWEDILEDYEREPSSYDGMAKRLSLLCDGEGVLRVVAKVMSSLCR